MTMRAALAVIAVLMSSAAPADDLADCGDAEAPPAAVIAACTALIETPSGARIAAADLSGLYNNRGLAHLRAAFTGDRDYSRAIADFDHAVEADPANPVALVNRGHARALDGDIRLALADFTAAVDVRPDLAAAQIARADALEVLGDHEAARSAYEAALAAMAAADPARSRIEARLQALSPRR